ncbi:MAG: phosphate ABC transporter ATP-binding protein [Peptococcaceae bacterium]|nr:phosphate ABC transporter ATP-binding protein [Peptococcaceae bacterium]
MSENFVSVSEVNVSFGAKQVLFDVNIEAPAQSVYAFIGPSGCGKTTLLRCINRMNDLTPSFRLTGEIRVNGDSVYEMKTDRQARELRRRIGMIFQRPMPLRMSVMRNMLFPYREHYQADKKKAAELAVEKLRLVGLYDEVKERLDAPAGSLSGGQQQRLCIARALMLDTGLLLLDEPCSALDPVSTFQIEDLLMKLKQTHTIIMVTHNMEQARRISDRTAFFYQGRVVESGATLQVFFQPEHELTQKYVQGII